jgi:hypothetical protein
MTYGIEIYKNSTTVNLDQTMPGGRLFVQRIIQPEGTTGSYTFTSVPSGDDLIIYTAAAGFHSIAPGTSGGSATLTLGLITKPSLSNYVSNTDLLIFATNSKEPNYGIETTNNTGQRIISTVLPCPIFLGSVVPSLTATVSLTGGAIGGWPYFYRHDYTGTVSSSETNGNRMVLWALPNDTGNNVWYTGSSIISPTVSNTINMSILSNSATPPACPRGYIFELDNIQDSTDSYGIRIYNNSGNVTFDSGYSHLNIVGINSNVFYTSPILDASMNTVPVTVNTFNISAYSGLSTPISFIPAYYLEEAIPIPSVAASKVFSLEGWVRRETTNLKLATIGSFYQEDSQQTWFYELGGYNQVAVTVDGTKY